MEWDTESLEAFQEDLQALIDDGYRVVPGLLSAGELSALRAELEPHLPGTRFGRNPFEGRATERVYDLAGRGEALRALIEHPRVMPVCDAMLGEQCLLSTAQAIAIHPGEVAQPLHFDDGFVQIPRGNRPVLNVTAIWAIDEFDEHNGATVIVPGSHTWGDVWPDRGAFPADTGGARLDEREADAHAVCMPAGSLLLFVGTLWHGGGANSSGRARLGIANQYCQPYLRPQETQLLSHPPELARRYSPRMQALLGYSVHPPFMGHVRGEHPARLLEGEPDER